MFHKIMFSNGVDKIFKIKNEKHVLEVLRCRKLFIFEIIIVVLKPVLEKLKKINYH